MPKVKTKLGKIKGVKSKSKTPKVKEVKVPKNEEPKVPTVEEKKEEKLETPTIKEPEKLLPTFEGVKVVKVLDSNHTTTHFHCQMENGTTMHVPRTLFE